MNKTPPTLFDPVVLVEDIQLTTHKSEHIARPARVGFVAGMLAVWIFGDDKKQAKAHHNALKEIARDAIERAGKLNQGGTP